MDELKRFLHIDQQNEPLPANTAPRPALHDVGNREPSTVFRALSTPSPHVAAWTLNQLYLAMPNPDKNWAGDCQTGNFHTRLWEAQLLASFRAQGLLVEQPHPSPDFRIENRKGGAAWVEAVTANPVTPYDHVNAPPSVQPEAREELFFGSAALRFAKTLGSTSPDGLPFACMYRAPTPPAIPAVLYVPRIHHEHRQLHRCCAVRVDAVERLPRSLPNPAGLSANTLVASAGVLQIHSLFWLPNILYAFLATFHAVPLAYARTVFAFVVRPDMLRALPSVRTVVRGGMVVGAGVAATPRILAISATSRSSSCRNRRAARRLRPAAALPSTPPKRPALKIATVLSVPVCRSRKSRSCNPYFYGGNAYFRSYLKPSYLMKHHVVDGSFLYENKERTFT